MNKNDMLMLAGLIGVAYAINSSRTQSPSAAPEGGTGGAPMQSGGPLSNIIGSLLGGGPVASSTATAPMLKQRYDPLSAQKQITQIQKTYGVNTPIKTNVGGDPLQTQFITAGQVSQSFRRPANEAEHQAARRANMESIARSDPSYKNTISYKKVMGG